MPFRKIIDEERVARSVDTFKSLYRAVGGDRIVTPAGTARGNALTRKSDDPVLGGTSGWTAVTAGPKMFNALYTGANVLGMLEKEAFATRAHRVYTANETTTAAIAEDATTLHSDKPDQVRIEHSQRIVQSVGEIGRIADIYGQAENYDVARELYDYYLWRHPQVINNYLWADVDSEATAYDSLTKPLSIDRAISSDAEESEHSGFASIYNLNRGGGATWADSVVSLSSADREFSLNLVDTMIDALQAKGTNLDSLCIVTGPATITEMSRHLADQKMLVDQREYKMSLGGLTDAQPGEAGGFRLNTYKGYPIMSDPAVPSDTLPRMYFIDLSDMRLVVGQPTMWEEESSPIAVGKPTTKVSITTMLELVCRTPSKHGKIRDLKPATF